MCDRRKSTQNAFLILGLVLGHGCLRLGRIKTGILLFEAGAELVLVLGVVLAQVAVEALRGEDSVEDADAVEDTERQSIEARSVSSHPVEVDVASLRRLVEGGHDDGVERLVLVEVVGGLGHAEGDTEVVRVKAEVAHLDLVVGPSHLCRCHKAWRWKEHLT